MKCASCSKDINMSANRFCRVDTIDGIACTCSVYCANQEIKRQAKLLEEQLNQIKNQDIEIVDYTKNN